MSDTYLFADSFANFPDGSQNRLRGFLDAADSASPYQDPRFFGSGRLGEINLLVEKDGSPVFFALGFDNASVSRFVLGLRSLVVHKGPVADNLDALLLGLQALKKFGPKKHLCEIQISPQISDDKSSAVTQMCDMLGYKRLTELPTMTLRLNITRGVQELVAGFKKRTRYEVKRAERAGIVVRRAENEADLMFWITALNVKYRDFRYVIPFIVQLGIYVSPIGFSSNLVPEKWRLLYSLNQMAGVIDGFRWAILRGETEIYWPGFALSLLVTAFFLWLGITQFRKMERTFADLI